MKRIIKTVLLLTGVIVFITFCERLQPPETPIPLSPDEIMIKEASPVVFVWQTADEADNYALQIATDEEFENTVYVDSSITDTSLVVDAETFEKLTMYYWQVAASNRAGSSEWSKTNRFFYGTQDWLILPADSTIINDAPTLVWHSYPQTTGYVVRICRNSFSTYNAIWEDTVSDTTYQLPYEVLMENHPATYHWSVMFLGSSENLFWTPSRCFLSRIMVDLDTTYYPFGLGYEWCYERHDAGVSYQDGHLIDEWDNYDTFAVNVVDSFWQSDTLIFSLDRAFQDVGENPKIIDSKICIRILFYYCCSYDTIPLSVDQDTAFMAPDGVDIAYEGDHLSMSWSYFPSMSESCYEGLARQKGVGYFSDYSSYDHPPSGSYHNTHTRLLWFYNGKDTVYDASQSEAFRSSAKSCTARYRTSRQD